MSVMNLYTVADLARFDERVQDAIDAELDKLRDPSANRDRVAHRLGRLRSASDWFTMMQYAVKTDAQCIQLDNAVSCVMFDFYLTDKDVKA